MTKFKKIVASTAVVATAALLFSTVADADTYTVKKGDTLWDIARNNGTTVEQLMNDNNLRSDLIFPGDELSYNVVGKHIAQAKETGFYTVKAGDTLFKIASQFGLTVDTLVKSNSIENPNFILVGKVLNVTGVVNETAPATEEKQEAVSEPQVTEEKQEAPQAPATQEVKQQPVAQQQVAQQQVAKQSEPVQTQQAPSSSNKANAIYSAAIAQLGRYQDCTMLVTNALRSVGINHHSYPAGYMALGTVVSASEAVPGDLIYYANGGLGYAHIAVYAGGGQAVHGGFNGNQTVLTTAYLGSGPVFIRVA